MILTSGVALGLACIFAFSMTLYAYFKFSRRYQTSKVTTTEIPRSEVTTTEIPKSEVTSSEIPSSEIPSSEIGPKSQQLPASIKYLLLLLPIYIATTFVAGGLASTMFGFKSRVTGVSGTAHNALEILLVLISFNKDGALKMWHLILAILYAFLITVSLVFIPSNRLALGLFGTGGVIADVLLFANFLLLFINCKRASSSNIYQLKAVCLLLLASFAHLSGALSFTILNKISLYVLAQSLFVISSSLSVLLYAVASLYLTNPRPSQNVTDPLPKFQWIQSSWWKWLLVVFPIYGVILCIVVFV